jgi:G:T-mismatch repair DNA endonuclease (very short patch repair protein)
MTDIFIEKAKKIHGEIYDYSKVIYKKAILKVIVICKKHGEFEQQPSNHLSGYGCVKCGILTRNASSSYTTNDFIKKAQKIHGEIYDYSKVNYINSTTKVIITCKQHGEFEQTPGHHLQKQGCPECGGHVKLNTKEFIVKSTKIHGETYDYSKVNYINNSTNVIIICKQHGEFKQVPSSHYNNGQGCPTCGRERTRQQLSLTTDDFIKKAQKIHGEIYDYSKVNYINNSMNIIIICKDHGEFEQQPSNHLMGKGCQICGRERTRQQLSLTTDDFIENATKIHGEIYDYSKVNYINSTTKVNITCKSHGEFEQTPGHHLMGQGCQICGHERIRLHKLSNVEEFIEKAKQIHGNNYDYYKVKYINSTTKVIITCKEHSDFNIRPTNHIGSKQGCPECQLKKTYSKSQIQWLNFIQSYNNITIQHAENEGEFVIPDTRYKKRADGYCKETNTIYEFHGDYWHGNPKVFLPTEINKSTHTTFGELYQKTLERECYIKEMGYNLVIMWEYDWLKTIKSVRIIQKKYRLIRK